MDRSSSERGYALLLVLLSIVFITLLTAVFFRLSLANAKQEYLIDTHQLTVVSAEAGIEFYKIRFNNLFYESIPVLQQEAERLISIQQNEQAREKNNGNGSKKGKENNKENDYYVIDYRRIQEDINKMLYDTIKKEVDKINKSADKKQLSNKYYFQPSNLYAEINDDKKSIKLTGDIIGTNSNDDYVKKLTFQQDFQTLNFDPSSASPSENQSTAQIDIRNLYPSNVPSEKCLSGKIDDKVCVSFKTNEIKEIEESIVYFPDGYSNEKKGNVKIDESTIYSKSSFHVKNMNELEDSYLYINGSFEAMNMNDIEETLFVVNGPLTIKSNTKIDDSQIVVNGNLSVAGKAEIEDSRVCVAGDMSVGGKLELEDDTRIYISGSITYSKLHGNINKIIKMPSKEAALEQCKVYTSSKVSKDEWPTPTIDVEYR